VAAGGGTCPTGASAGTGYRQYIHDEDGRLVGEYDSSGDLIAEHLWLGDTPVAVLKPASSSVVFGGTIAGNWAVYYVQPDQLNTPRLVVNSANVAVWTWDSAPFGESVADQNPAGLGTFAYSLRFPGQQFDSTTRLHYNYYRDYEPATGRYVQVDPLIVAGVSDEPFSYAGASPLLYTDFYGLKRGTRRNDDQSPTWLYQLIDRKGCKFKNGISCDPDRRYSKTWLQSMGLEMRKLRCYDDRGSALRVERWLTERSPGPGNREKWAGRKCKKCK
jgi:RHS repeat-associated protein